MNTRPLGFPRERRLLTPADYRRAFAEPSRSGDGCFTVLYSPNGLQYARLGLAIAKKALRRAVHRNLVKRLVRESFRQHQGALLGRDIVVLFRPGASVRDRKALHDSLARHWRRVGHAGSLNSAADRPDQAPADGGAAAAQA